MRGRYSDQQRINPHPGRQEKPALGYGNWGVFPTRPNLGIYRLETDLDPGLNRLAKVVALANLDDVIAEIGDLAAHWAFNPASISAESRLGLGVRDTEGSTRDIGDLNVNALFPSRNSCCQLASKWGVQESRARLEGVSDVTAQAAAEGIGFLFAEVFVRAQGHRSIFAFVEGVDIKMRVWNRR